MTGGDRQGLSTKSIHVVCIGFWLAVVEKTISSIAPNGIFKRIRILQFQNANAVFVKAAICIKSRLFLVF